MDFKYRYWLRGEPDSITFGWLYRYLDLYLNPEVNNLDGLQEFTRSNDADAAAFKRQLREAIENFDDEVERHIDYISAYDDDSGAHYLRRVWRDLYPGEAVPGGDDEFREALRQTILQDLDELPEMLIHYIDFDLPDFRPAARTVWELHFPNEPVPEP
ncbi:hypothetical protein [Microlunatus sp. GCM10028923]|uniref:hypothetical protein n=1 Tax=Microlunatus sp. GCM10028923 TaxID=3273400 RepID=UPI003617861D